MFSPFTCILAISKSVQGLGGSAVKNPPARQEKQVRSLGQEDPLGKETATHPSVLSWKILWTEEPGVRGVTKELDMNE